MKNAITSLALLILAAPLGLPAAEQVEGARRSLVRVSATALSPDYQNPWNPGKTGSGVGAGFVIAGQRILTNAHVVSNARFISVDREGDPRKYLARVQHVAHDCDLAVLELDDAGFFKNAEPLELGGIPALESTVSVYGYPIGGDRMSVTRGVVSRIDFLPYSHSAVDMHLTIQIDAAINPGNSGGPVVQDGKLVGVAFQGYSGAVAQNVGYMIPTPVVRRFLKDIEDGHYDRYVDLAVTYFELVNPAQRKALGLPDNDRGVMVASVLAEGSCDGVLEPGDVLLQIDEFPIASDGYVEIEGERVEMPEVVERKFRGDKIRFGILRGGQEKSVEATLKPANQFMIQAARHDVRPRYVLFAGLLFQPLGRDFLETYRIEDLRVRYFYDSFVADQIYKERPEVIILSNILADPINTYVTGFRNAIVDEINGRKIRRLQDVAEAFDAAPEYHVIKLVGEGRPIVLEQATVAEARRRILERYQVLAERNLQDEPARR